MTEYLQSKLEVGTMESNILLGAVKLIDNSSRETAAFNDPHYFPFYYYLGTQTSPKKVCQIGAKLGLIGASFMQGCKTVETWTAMENITEPRQPANIIGSNLKMFCKGSAGFMGFHDSILQNGIDEYRIDMGFLTEKYDKQKTDIYLEFFWKHLKSEGLLVVDYIDVDDVKAVFHDFCRVKNREPVVFKTRYGVGIITR